jgi:hypothetical protein
VQSESTKRWKKKYPARHGEHQWRVSIKSVYGWTAEDYFRKLAEQGGGCGICGCKPGETQKKRLSIDHNHLTGTNRGILCNRCNYAVGQLKDSPERAEALARYLRSYQ